MASSGYLSGQPRSYHTQQNLLKQLIKHNQQMENGACVSSMVRTTQVVIHNITPNPCKLCFSHGDLEQDMSCCCSPVELSSFVALQAVEWWAGMMPRPRHWNTMVPLGAINSVSSRSGWQEISEIDYILPVQPSKGSLANSYTAAWWTKSRVLVLVP